MPTITYRTPAGESQTFTVDHGATVMRTAITNGVRGIIGECGGQAMCATCHVYVLSSDAELTAPSDDEQEMLDCTAAPRENSSRLGCQLRAGMFTEITVQLPERQV